MADDTSIGDRPKSCAARICAVQAKMQRVKKTGRNDFHKYDYATESDIADAVRQACEEEGLAIVCLGVDRESFEVHERGKGAFWRIWMKWRLVNADDPSDYYETVFPGESADTGDKGVTKAITSCQKYFLIKFFNIATGDKQDDIEAHEPGVGAAPRTARRESPAQAQRRRQQPPKPGGGDPEMRPLGEEHAKTLRDKLRSRNLILEDLVRFLKEEKGAENILKGIEYEPSKWPFGIGADIKKFFDDNEEKKEPNWREADTEQVQMEQLNYWCRRYWLDRVHGRPAEGSPQDPYELAGALLEHETLQGSGKKRIETAIEMLKGNYVDTTSGEVLDIPF